MNSDKGTSDYLGNFFLEYGKAGSLVVGQRKESREEDFQNEIKICEELETLNLTLNQQAWGGSNLLQEAVLDHIGREDFGEHGLASWASRLVGKVAVCAIVQRKEFSYLGQETLQSL